MRIFVDKVQVVPVVDKDDGGEAGMDYEEPSNNVCMQACFYPRIFCVIKQENNLSPKSQHLPFLCKASDRWAKMFDDLNPGSISTSLDSEASCFFRYSAGNSHHIGRE
ncbi:hypothetical protein H5410_010944 [Solanum commersonii]|uniref:Uncharacterized protein n=1 Tax=Solanum commersonii TaxID=4109 RepID=A0A9J6AM88_SOLCO|nr:hypothetical protein H5410_010944 [Solanum commersonii]